MQVPHVHVPHAACAAPLDHSNGRRGVQLQDERQLDAHLGVDAAEPDAFVRNRACSVELSFAAAECQRSLASRVGALHGSSHDQHSAAGRLAGLDLRGPIRVAHGLHRLHASSARDEQLCPRPMRQVAPAASKPCPVLLCRLRDLLRE
eukprot:11180037-Lingulodinium_polyedra.AAC.1